jgi:hypothetical protein
MWRRNHLPCPEIRFWAIVQCKRNSVLFKLAWVEHRFGTFLDSQTATTMPIGAGREQQHRLRTRLHLAHRLDFCLFPGAIVREAGAMILS